MKIIDNIASMYLLLIINIKLINRRRNGFANINKTTINENKNFSKYCIYLFLSLKRNKIKIGVINCNSMYEILKYY